MDNNEFFNKIGSMLFKTAEGMSKTIESTAARGEHDSQLSERDQVQMRQYKATAQRYRERLERENKRYK